MKKLLIVIAGLVCAFALTANAKEAKHKLTPEQKALRKELLEKYDTNKNGKLDKAERAKISKEDRDRMQQAGLGHKKRQQSKG
jgi:hypothetical protein